VSVGQIDRAYGQVSPKEELRTLKAADGIEVSLFASEPMITNPAAIDVDTEGRVWVAEIQWYRRSAKNPPADKIKVLEDIDGDGRADKATVFADGLLSPMSICVAGSKVYVATSPDLWVYEDRDGDLKADGPPKRILTGFGGANHDHGAHSLVLGPDHKWWMSHGDTGFNVTGTDGSKIKYKWGAVLRGEFDGSQLETVAVNFRNPYEVCVSSFGEAFLSDNDNDGNESVRICWIMDGGDYGWFGGPPPRVPPGTPFGEHWHFRGHIPGFVPATLVTGFGSPTGICFYEGDAFGAKYKNAPLHTDCGPREVRLYRHKLEGAGMKATSEVFVSNQGDNYFRPDDICTAPDGRLYVSDWYDGGVGGHGYNNPDQGRIFMLRPKGAKLRRHEIPGPYTNVSDAVEGLKSPNLATQFLARERLLAEGQASMPALLALLSHAEPNFRARALWVLDRLGGSAQMLVARQLRSADPAMRALAVRILRRHGKQYAEPILQLSNDSAGEVQREVLLAIRNLKGENADDALLAIAKRYDGQDRYLLEAINIAAADRRERLYAQLTGDATFSLPQFSLLQLLDPKAACDLLIAELVGEGVDEAKAKPLLDAAGSAQAVEAGLSLLELVGNPSAAPAVRRLALEKIVDNLSGRWSSLKKNETLLATFKQLLGEKDLRDPALTAIGRLGLVALSDPVLAMSQSNQNDPALRAKAIEVAVQAQAPNAAAAIRGLLSDPQPAVRRAALNALVDMQDVKTLRAIFSSNKFPADLRAQVAERLMETSGGAVLLLRFIDQNLVPAKLKKVAVNKAINHPDSNVRVLFEKFVPAADLPKRLGSSIKPEEILALRGDAQRGGTIFNQSSAAQCKSCHSISTVGGTLGPDLSMIGKKYDRKALLETILDPSKAIAPEYVPYLLATDGGQVHVGFLVEKSADHVLLKDTKSRMIRVAADEVDALEPQTKSLMPELVLRDITAKDAADLLAFLTTLKVGTHTVKNFLILGPFDSPGQSLDVPLPPEKNLVAPDIKATYDGLDGHKIGWEVVSSDGSVGYSGIDSVRYDQSRGLRTTSVAHYFLVFADSAADQDVLLLVGSDDGCKVWVNGQQVHRNPVSRGLALSQDQVPARFREGRNVVMLKVENGEGMGGASLAVRCSEAINLKTE